MLKVNSKYMQFLIKKLSLNLIFNSCLFICLIIGIQNSSNKSKVNLLTDYTIDLPISFIVGSSFITGSFLGGLLTQNFDKHK